MTNEILLGSSLVIIAALIAAVSQLLLKLAARKTYSVWWRSYLNVLVISAYGMFFGTTLFNAIAMRYIPLSLAAALDASGQIFVPVLSILFLREKISKRKWLGMLMIVIGIVVFSL